MTSLRRAALASLITVLLLALALPVSPVAAQGLGAAAARERAKRAKQAGGPEGAGKTFSNEDLERGKPKGAKKTPAAAQPTPPATSAPVASPEPDKPAPRAEPNKPGPDIAELEAKIKVLQDKLNPMSGSYIHGAFGSLDPNEEARVRSELQQLEAELAKAREELANPPVRPQENRPDL